MQFFTVGQWIGYLKRFSCVFLTRMRPQQSSFHFDPRPLRICVVMIVILVMGKSVVCGYQSLLLAIIVVLLMGRSWLEAGFKGLVLWWQLDTAQLTNRLRFGFWCWVSPVI